MLEGPMNTIPIDKEIPIPPAKNEKYPFRQMRVGESFVFGPDVLHSVRSTAALYKKLQGALFRIASTPGGFRCWRVDRMPEQEYYPVEKGIPILAGRLRTYPFHIMKPGDSFFVPARKYTVLWQSVNKANRDAGKQFYFTRVGDGYRCWCVEKQPARRYYPIDKELPCDPKWIPLPFDRMEIGDSFAFPPEQKRRVRMSARRYVRGRQWDYIIGEHQGQWRCWRIS